MNREIFLCCLVMFFSQIAIWFQLNSQLVWEWAKGTKSMWIMCLLGIPISLSWLYATKWGYTGFGALWPVRLMGFAIGMISFPIITWFILGESITLKTMISIVLAVIIMFIQIIL